MRVFFLFYSLVLRIIRKFPIEYFVNYLVFSYNGVQLPKRYYFRGIPYLNNLGSMIIGNNLVINSNVKANPVAGDRRTTIYVGKGATLVIGENVGISSPKIICTEKIVIENDVNIGACCDIYDSDHHSVNYVDRIINGNINVKSGAVFIRRGAWLGASVIVLKGVEIGEMAVIAAGAVVTKSVPGGELWGGNPARFIRVISEPPCKTAVAPAAV